MNADQQTQVNVESTEETVKPVAKQVSRRSWRLIVLFSSVSLGAAIALLALHFLSPTIPGRAETLPARVTWYLTQGQWRPDSRTFAAAWDYFLRTENEMPTESSIDNGPVAATPTETTLPKS